MFIIEVKKFGFVQLWYVKRRGNVLMSGWAWTVEKAKAKALSAVEGVM